VQDRDASVRQRAIEALGEVGGAAVRELLSWALRADEDPFVRYQALVGLAAIGDETAMALARRALDDPHELIRSKAEELVDVHERGAER
jgi:HEAT repeat protein